METSNVAVAAALSEIAALLRASKSDMFRVRAYERAARVVRSSPVVVATMEEPELRRLNGIGPAMAGVITELVTTGSVGILDTLREQEPAGVGALLGLPLIGLRDARALAGTHGFRDVAALEAAADSPGGLAHLDERLASRVRESLRRQAKVQGDRTPLPFARQDAAGLAQRLAAMDSIVAAEVAGDVRRGQDQVGDLDIVAVGDGGDVMATVVESTDVVRVVESRRDVVTVLTASGRPARIWPVGPDGAGAALLHATGAPAHVAALCDRAAAAGLTLRADGLWRDGERIAGTDEEGIYRALGLDVVPPELREGLGEVEAAAAGTLPDLVTVEDLRGDLHVHTDWSRDGKATMASMVAAAEARGYEYVALTDHAENLKINGMPREKVLARRREIAEMQQRHPAIRILDAAELNIGLDGSIDYDLEFLATFDFGVASIHSHMDRLSAVQTQRILTAIAHPAVHVIGHPTGRILGHRPAYGIEIRDIAQAAAETGTALEVNGSPRRLDLCGEMVKAAVEAGALIALSSDAHSVPELDYVANCVPNARRGWATRVDVLNCRPLVKLLPA